MPLLNTYGQQAVISTALQAKHHWAYVFIAAL